MIEYKTWRRWVKALYSCSIHEHFHNIWLIHFLHVNTMVVKKDKKWKVKVKERDEESERERKRREIDTHTHTHTHERERERERKEERERERTILSGMFCDDSTEKLCVNISDHVIQYKQWLQVHVRYLNVSYKNKQNFQGGCDQALTWRIKNIWSYKSSITYLSKDEIYIPGIDPKLISHPLLPISLYKPSTHELPFRLLVLAKFLLIIWDLYTDITAMQHVCMIHSEGWYGSNPYWS